MAKRSKRSEAQDDQNLRRARIYERLVKVYDIVLPGGKIYRWDTLKEAQNFSTVNQCPSAKVIKIPAKYVRETTSLVDKTTPNALVRKSVARIRIKNQPHLVEKA